MVKYLLNLLLVYGCLFPGVHLSKEIVASVDNVYLNDFEGIQSDRELGQNFSTWEDGALVEASLTREFFHSGEKAMRVEMKGINPTNQSTNGSLYHTLNSWQNNWSGGTGLRFWIKNDADEPLLLNFNFKEKYNEYWAIAQQGIFYFEDETGNLVQQEIYYSNLLIPGGYEGSVLIPFSSFEVPEWNTARGDETMQLDRVESYALGMSLGNRLPQVFYVDDIEIITRADYPSLLIFGEEWVSAPASGELAVYYSAQIRIHGDELLEDTAVEWSCEGPLTEDILFTPQGKLTVPAGVDSQKITLSAAYSTESGKIMNTREVHILGLDAQAEGSLDPTATFYVTPLPTDYQKFSSDFEKWTTRNRALFVILLVGGILVVLAVLSALQRRLK